MKITAADFITQRGASDIAEKIGKPVGAVYVSKHRNRLPRDWWPELQVAYPDVTLSDLLKIEAASEKAA